MLMAKGYLSEEQVRKLRREHANARQQASNTMRSAVSLSRFARALIQAGAVVELEVMKASRDQEAEKAAGKSRSLGSILIERGFITRDAIEVIVADQIAKAPTCPKCTDFFLATRAAAGNLFECAGCGYKLMMPRQVTQLMDLNEVNALREDAGLPRRKRGSGGTPAP
jgi:hypothetical protein